MSDYLSQDEIDSLLSGLSEGDGGGGDGGEGRYKALTPVFELFCKQAESVLGTAVAKKVDLAPEGGCSKADFAAVKEKLQGPTASITLSVASGVEGDMYLVMRKKDVAVLADLMMMGDGSAEYGDETAEAATELFNQVMGAFCTALGADIGESASAGGVSVSGFDLDNPPFGGDTADMGIAKLTVEGGMIDSFAALLIPNSFGDEIVEKKSPKPAAPADSGVGISQSEMDALTSMTAAGFGGGDAFGGSSSSFSAPPPQRTSTYNGPKENIDLLLDVELEINIELGKSELSIKRILELAPGSIVELDKMAGEPVDLIVNNKIVAKGEVVVVDENFGIRIVSLVSAEDRIKSLR